MTDDPFGTAAIRARVLAGWRAAAARFREDANTEEDFALGGYRDRVVIELAQNAADAAAAAGTPGRVRFTLSDQSMESNQSEGDQTPERPVLVVANTGTPLSAAGVESLATLRASAKRDDAATVGRFGVGFAAVLAVSDEPTILSRTGGARFSREDSAALTAEAAGAEPELAAELRRRDGHVPVLRLPYPASGEPPAGYDTAVVLPLRDDGAVELVRRLLAEIGDALLLALPTLARLEVEVDGVERVVTDVEDRWHSRRTGGTWTRSERAQLLADRPTEERARPFRSVIWSIPRHAGIELPAVVCAPTPTDEPMSSPALLIATFPLDPSRRNVAPGPLTDRIVAEAATAYADLVRERAKAGDDITALIPTGLPAGRLDAELRESIVAALATTPCLVSVEDGTLLRPRDAVILDGPLGADPEVLRALCPLVAGLVAAPTRSRAAYDALGIRRLQLADLVDELASVGAAHSPERWRELYAALAPGASDPGVREALGALPVPLADGRVVRGARGLMLPGGDVSAEVLAALAPFGLRAVHPDAAHDLLERLGAIVASPRGLLGEPAVRAAVADSPDADDPEALADAVLGLIAAAGELAPGELAHLGELALPDDTGELAPAVALVLPDSPAAAILDPDEFAAIDRAVLDRWGAAPLVAVGVVDTLGVIRATDVDLDALPDELAELDEFEEWAGTAGGSVGELSVIRDLEFVRDWPRTLALMAERPELRRALTDPVRVIEPHGHAVDRRSYAGWWLRRNAVVDGRSLGTAYDPDAGPELAAVLDAPPDWLLGLDRTVRQSIGLVRQLADLDATGVRLVLDRLAEESRSIDTAIMLRLWAQLGGLDDEVTADVDPPARVRVLTVAGTAVVDAERAVVVDAPMWLQRPDLGGHVVASGAAAETLTALLDLPTARELAPGAVAGGTPTPVPAAVRHVVPGAPTTWWAHDELLVDGNEADWWVDETDRPHAATSDGLARALAQAAGRWSERHLLAALLAEPDREHELVAELAYDPYDR